MEQEKNKMEQGKSKQQRMRELVELLNRARKAYEQDNTEIMSNYEYDRLYDELEELEKELGTKMANSPTGWAEGCSDNFGKGQPVMQSICIRI